MVVTHPSDLSVWSVGRLVGRSGDWSVGRSVGSVGLVGRSARSVRLRREGLGSRQRPSVSPRLRLRPRPRSRRCTERRLCRESSEIHCESREGRARDDSGESAHCTAPDLPCRRTERWIAAESHTAWTGRYRYLPALQWKRSPLCSSA